MITSDAKAGSSDGHERGRGNVIQYDASQPVKVFARKPSERLTRIPMKANARNSKSERVQILGLIDRVFSGWNSEKTTNGYDSFHDYKP